MIDNPFPSDWRDLQRGVERIFTEVGLAAEQNKIIATPRGSVEVDVYAVDTGSVDQISYVVECKNWTKPIDQSVIHSFTTVMHETGANIGFVVSQHGLQKGAQEYTRNTNILGFTYEDFQARYFSTWLERHFMPKLGRDSDALTQYTEPINSRRDRFESSLSSADRARIEALRQQYASLGLIMAVFRTQHFLPALGLKLGRPGARDLPTFVKALSEIFPPDTVLKAQTYRELLDELLQGMAKATEDFNRFFGKNIFE